MRLHLIFVLFSAAVAVSSIAAPRQSCSSVMKEFKTIAPAEFESCVCDERLAYLHAPLRHPFRVVAACHMQWGSGRPIVLGRERIRLDRYTDNDYPKGVLFVTGEAELKGSLLYSPGPAGEFWFTPDTPLLKADKKRPLLPDLKFTTEPPHGLHIPTPLQSADCWRSKVTLSVRGMKIVLWDNDEEGAWPVIYEVLRARNFTSCKE